MQIRSKSTENIVNMFLAYLQQYYTNKIYPFSPTKKCVTNSIYIFKVLFKKERQIENSVFRCKFLQKNCSFFGFHSGVVAALPINELDKHKYLSHFFYLLKYLRNIHYKVLYNKFFKNCLLTLL